MALNDAQKLDYICAALGINPQTGAPATPTFIPPASTVDPTALQTAVNSAISSNTQIQALVAGVADIQYQVDEPAPTVTTQLNNAATSSGSSSTGSTGAAGGSAGASS